MEEIKMINIFEKIKEKYSVIVPIDTINNIDIIAVAHHDLQWLIEEVENLQTENERYKNINQGLLDVQISLREKEREYQQWFEVASSNVQRKDKVIENQFKIIKGLESEIEKLEEDNYDLRIESGNI
jgi:TPP-dependent trihydroxycyclohexane-1,2-dione (THcHDO) dehydratase